LQEVVEKLRAELADLGSKPTGCAMNDDERGLAINCYDLILGDLGRFEGSTARRLASLLATHHANDHKQNTNNCGCFHIYLTPSRRLVLSVSIFTDRLDAGFVQDFH
jgi:hypothetical protein